MHGVERWRSNCGCNGGKPGWNQAWRAPLRQALDELRDALAPLTEQEDGKLFKDVWAARDAYIQVVLDRSAESVDRFFAAHQAHPLSDAERVRALELMEMQRHAQLMYTSCGWFFDDIAGIETVQIIAYAARVLQLATQVFGEQAAALEPAFLARLAEAKSNDPDGRRRRPHLQKMRRHHGAAPRAGRRPLRHQFRLLLVCRRDRPLLLITSAASPTTFTPPAADGWRWAAHTLPAPSPATQQSFSFAVLHFGDQNITAAVKPYDDADARRL